MMMFILLLLFDRGSTILIPQATYSVEQSSHFGPKDLPTFPAHNAVDGNVMSWSYTSCQDKPWLKVRNIKFIFLNFNIVSFTSFITHSLSKQ